jgi:hypothetical protein
MSISRYRVRTLAAGGLLLALYAASCVIDTKGKVCGFIGVLSDGEGHQYCRDDVAAQAECETLNDAFIAAAVACAGDTANEDDVRANVSLENCDNAGATTIELEDCINALNDADDPPCDGADFDKPDVCQGIVLDGIFSDNLPG